MIVIDNIATETPKFCKHGLDFYTDKHGRKYFYVSNSFYPHLSYRHSDGKKSKVFKLLLDQPPARQEYLKTLDFELKHAELSPCGHYFWSFQIKPEHRRNGRQRLIFRQIDPETFEFTEYGVSELADDGEMKFLCLHYTSTTNYLLIYTRKQVRRETRLFRFYLNHREMKVEIRPIPIPKLPTKLYTVMIHYRKFNHNFGVCGSYEDPPIFYHIGYHGQIYVLEYEDEYLIDEQTSKWILYSPEGQTPEPWIIPGTPSLRGPNSTSDPAIPSFRVPPGKEHEESGYRMLHGDRMYGRNGVLHSTYYQAFFDRSYRLEFDRGKRVCRGTYLFTTKELPTSIGLQKLYLARDDQAASLIIINSHPCSEYKEANRWEIFNRRPALTQLAYWTVMDMAKDGKLPLDLRGLYPSGLESNANDGPSSKALSGPFRDEMDETLDPKTKANSPKKFASHRNSSIEACSQPCRPCLERREVLQLISRFKPPPSIS